MREIEALRKFAGSPCLVFSASRTLDKPQEIALLEKLEDFFRQWQSHGDPVEGMAVVLENRFLVVAHRSHGISGCSRDALLFFVQGLGRELDLEWLGGARVFYRDEDGLPADVDRPAFKALFREGRIHPDTVVYDTTVQKTDAILEGRFALPISRSWHMRLVAQAPVPA